MDDPVPYPAGLILSGRKVVVVGGGSVAQRRVPGLIAAGALVHVVSPEVTPALEGLAAEVEIHLRPFTENDLDDAWYAIAATDDPEVNAAVVSAAQARHTFCVRADDALHGSAWTPATGRHGSTTVAVLSNREPMRSAALRDAILTRLRDGEFAAQVDDDAPTPGVVLVGGGPGDPDLLTVAGRQALATADVVVADRLAPREVLDALPPEVELIDVAKLPRGRSATQEFINETLVDRARRGKRVVRFKGGESFVFGRGFEEVIACREAGVPVEVEPGLSSAIAVPTRAQIPVTHRGVAHEFTVVSGHVAPGDPESLVDWDALARLRGTVVILMGVHHAGAIASALIAGGRSAETAVAVLQEGTMPAERSVFTTLAALESDILREQVRPPAVIVAGDVVALARPEAYPRG